MTVSIVFVMNCWKIYYLEDINWVIAYDSIDSISTLIYAGNVFFLITQMLKTKTIDPQGLV